MYVQKLNNNIPKPVFWALVLNDKTYRNLVITIYKTVKKCNKSVFLIIALRLVVRTNLQFGSFCKHRMLAQCYDYGYFSFLFLVQLKLIKLNLPSKPLFFVAKNTRYSSKTKSYKEN